MGNKLVLIGGGGHCKSVLDSVLRMGWFDEIVITDPTMPVGTKVLGCDVIGTDDCLKDLHKNGFEYAFITVGSVCINPLREKLAEKIASIGFRFPIIVDPSARVSEYAVVGEGTYIGKHVTVNADAKIGRHCIINSGSIIEHECYVGDFSHVSVGAILCGEVNVGNSCMIGAGSTILQCLNVGNRVVIGANSTVLSNVGNDSVHYGVVKQ